MILVFGGTTEGRKAAEVLEESGSTFYYSTKTGEQELTLKHGVRTDGAMDGEAMRAFCGEHGIRLIVDAAHPFAAQLHKTIGEVARALDIPVVRYERIYPPRDADIEWIDSYDEVPTDIRSLLATTGVQSIGKLKQLEAKGVKVCYRILRRASSIALARAQGATDDQLCYYEDGDTIDVKADAILLKESGESGGFSEKVAAARRLDMRIIAIRRPGLPVGSYATWCNGPYGLRRAVEKLLPEFFALHSGLTTGTCATAAVVAAIRKMDGEQPEEVPVILPDGETIMVAVGYGEDYAYCIKDAGDDPDVTDGIRIEAHPQPLPSGKEASFTAGDWEIFAGEGIGHFTLPGFDYPPGEPAINKGPREMIKKNLEGLTTPLHSGRGRGWVCRLSVPSGADIARRTFNPRLGIEGGISIIGVSGIVKPFSEEAFINSIRKCMQVAKASGSERVVVNSGGKSERFVKGLYPTLPSQAFVEYGNYVGETLKAAHELGFKKVTLGVMLGKAVKLAAGHLDTHSKKTVMDKAFIGRMLHEAGIDIDLEQMTLARELWTLVPQAQLQKMADTIIDHCMKHCQPLLPDGELTILLIGEEGEIY
ncbi:cobalt-precorrin-5B (C(1))-methyltransferase CbiD [Xylanibacter brevis]|uniref:cobalt-precorrin-5B (C(1))-methyltransferase CbiD n=1 Tax=Xylanibacter brevis TaxID=83231 RepID=UPI0004834913|nr:cobalt-precorrin-5B (C(1))-methyltransferase CbiD [Xylanibacter brevis]